MPKEDYLIKSLEKLAQLVAGMLNLKVTNQPDKALSISNEVFSELIHLDIVAVSNLPIDEFIHKIEEAAYTNTYLELIGELTYETAFAFNAKGDVVSTQQFSAKALAILKLTNEKYKTFSFDREMKIDELKRLMR